MKSALQKLAMMQNMTTQDTWRGKFAKLTKRVDTLESQERAKRESLAIGKSFQRVS